MDKPTAITNFEYPYPVPKIWPMSTLHTNALINETSPYLLQHAHNPVHWEAWSTAVLDRAKKENKLLLISIGYAACHWCHVMEHECFEDLEVAETMNKNFINIKIDREERPDIDHIYMDALQMMTGQGGWPLNIVALPDGRPFWGATYVKKVQWIGVLGQLASLYQKNPEKILAYAQKLSQGIKAINLVEHRAVDNTPSIQQIGEIIQNWSGHFDFQMGGYPRAPKFMMPVNLNSLLHYATVQKDGILFKYVNTSLTKMAWGGIFDHVGGGFSRYSVDAKWHVPHFEKMLYDNGQMISLYAKAYAVTKNELYRRVVEQTISFIEQELTDPNFGFYSSLDADSLNKKGELEEGAYYVWEEKELAQCLKDDFKYFKDYFNINAYGLWEEGKYVLIRNKTTSEIAKEHNIPMAELEKKIKQSLSHLNTARNTRNRPRLDDKILASWNGLMLKGLVDAYRYLGEVSYLKLALKNARFLQTQMINGKGRIYHSHKNGKSTITGYLEDYATIIDAFLGLYEVCHDKQWLELCVILSDYCIENFLDLESGMFFFTSKEERIVIRRSFEVVDNVIPASNSIMAKNLYKLSKLFPEKNYGSIPIQMIKNVQDNFTNAQGYANWLQLAMFIDQPFYEIAVVGQDHQAKAQELLQHYIPNSLTISTTRDENLNLFKNRYVKDKTLIYVCIEGACKLPETDVQSSLKHMIYY